MAVSEVSICNRALQAIATRTTIASLTEASTEARACNLIYAETRDQVLNMAFWGFAQKTAYLALLKSAPGTPSGVAGAVQWTTSYPPPPWLYEYEYPNDCIMVRTILAAPSNAYVGVPLTSNGMSTYPYAIGAGAMFEVSTDSIDGTQQNVLLTNQYQAIARYTLRIINPQLFGANFTEALVQALAAKLALALTGKTSIANAKFQQANAIIDQARADDANEGLTVIDNMPDWLTCRDDYCGPIGNQGYTASYGPLFGYI